MITEETLCLFALFLKKLTVESSTCGEKIKYVKIIHHQMRELYMYISCINLFEIIFTSTAKLSSCVLCQRAHGIRLQEDLGVVDVIGITGCQ